MPPSRRGTGWTNLSTYLDLNKGAAQGMGDTLAGKLETDGQGVQSGLEGLQQGFTDQLGKPDATSSLAGMDGWSDLVGRGLDVNAQANALGTMGGTNTLLNKQYGPTSWGGGMLDAGLARAGGAGGRMENARGGYGKLMERLGSANTDSIKQAADYKPPGPAPLQKPENPTGAKVGVQRKQDDLDDYGVRPPPRYNPSGPSGRAYNQGY